MGASKFKKLLMSLEGTKSCRSFGLDDAEMLTSEMHDPYTRTTGAWKYENTKTPSKGGLRCGAGQIPSEG